MNKEPGKSILPQGLKQSRCSIEGTVVHDRVE
jgi:hypothetical protein